MERGEDLLNTAILLRTNQESEGLINVLMEYQVPFTMKEQLPNLFRHWICRALLAYLEMAAGDRSRKNFLEIMNRPNRYISREALNSSQINFNELREYYKRQRLDVRQDYHTGNASEDSWYSFPFCCD